MATLFTSSAGARRHRPASVRSLVVTLGAALVAVSAINGLAPAAVAAPAPRLIGAAAASAPLPGSTTVGQQAAGGANISMSTSGGLGGPRSVDGSVGLMLGTSTEVTAVGSDGSYTRRTTIDSLNVVAAPAGTDAQVGYDTLVGTTFDQQISANGTPVSSSLSGGLSPEQQVLGQGILDAMNAMVVGFPSDPVSVGSSWTVPGQVGVATDTVLVTYQCRLTSVSGDSYTVEVSYAQDVPPDATQGTLSGTVSGSGTLKGSISNPLVVSGTMYQSVDGVLSDSAGATPVSGDVSITLTATAA